MQESIETTEEKGLLALIMDVAGKGVAIVNGAIDQIVSEGRDAWLALKSFSESTKIGFYNRVAPYLAAKSLQELQTVMEHSNYAIKTMARAQMKQSFGIAA